MSANALDRLDSLEQKALLVLQEVELEYKECKDWYSLLYTVSYI